MYRRNPLLTVILVTFIFSAVDPAFTATDIKARKRQMREEEVRLNEMPETAAADLAGLNDYLTAGLARNPGIKAAFYEWKSAYSKIAQEFSLPDPQFTFNDYVKSVDMERSFSVEQMFPLPDKLWIKRNRAVKNSEAAYFNFEKARLDLINRIAEAYYEYAYLSKSIIITKETINLLRSFENVAQAKYASGTTQNQDLLKVQLELGKMENDLMAMEDMRRPLVASLNALLNLPQDSDLPWPSEDLENIDVDNTYSETEKLAAELKRNNPALLAMDETVGRETANLKLTKRAYFPDLTVGVTQEYMPAGMSGNEQEQRMVMFSINVPIWFNRINAEIEDARASLKAAENGRDNLKNEILSELAMAQYKLRNSVRQARLYKEALIPKAVQTLNATKSAYEAGGMDFLSLIEAQRELLNFQLIYYRQNADYQQRLIQMRSLIGTLRTDNESVRSTK